MDDLSREDLFLVGDKELKENGLAHHHINSANVFYTTGLQSIIMEGFKVNVDVINKRNETPEDKSIERIHVDVRFVDTQLQKPTTIGFTSHREEIIYPNQALTSDKTYAGNLYIDAEVTATAYKKDGSAPTVKKESVKHLKICSIPIMVGSVMCHTHGLSRKALQILKEDPDDYGGQYIVNGVEWVIDNVENILFNEIRIFKNEGHAKEVMRAEFVSKPGDAFQNMGYLLIRWLNNGQITVEIVRDKFRHRPLPFYVIFKMLGWTSDKQIYDNILYEHDSATAKKMADFLTDAFNAKYVHMPNSKNMYLQSSLMKAFVDEIKDESFSYLNLGKNPKAYKQAFAELHRTIDNSFLPHVGLNQASRHNKLRFLALIIRKMFLVKLGKLEQTDRDAFRSKRIHPAGISFAKPFKAYLNAAIIQKLKRNIIKTLNNIAFSRVNFSTMMTNSLDGVDFTRLLVQSITSGNKTNLKVNRQRSIPNRLSSQLLTRKNPLEVVSTLRRATTTTPEGAKQSERAHEMRRIHMTFLGYICSIYSPESEKVGINKQLALFTSVCQATSGEVIKDLLRDDDDITNLNDIDPLEIGKKMHNVYVNGDWVGCAEHPVRIVEKYRQIRRDLNINPTTTIVWDNVQNEAKFWTDVGRMLRPLFIVKNTWENAEGKGKFHQKIGLTRKHIDKLKRGNLDMHDLLKDQIIEYISPEEQENCYVCYSIDKLKDEQYNPLHRYTHCDIPESQLGITAHTSPFGNHNQATRNIYQTSQSRQTCGMPSRNWTYRCEKRAFVQYRNEQPLIKTISNRYTRPNGSNCIVALMCYSGYNQEDSIIVNEGAVKRGLFTGSAFTSMKTILERGEEFSKIDMQNTTDLKSANYEKINDDGFPEVGTIFQKNDAVIAKRAKIQSAKQKFMFSDRSLIYKEDEPAIVHRVIVGRNENGEKFCKLSLRKIRELVVGDKMSSRAGQKGIVARLMSDEDMPRTKDGMAPDLIINPHAIPSRMTIGQLIESVAGTLGAVKGTFMDGTIFGDVDIDAIGDELEKHGLNRHGEHKLFSGITGEYINAKIFMGVTFYQRLQKFVNDQEYTVSKGSTDTITFQPLDGKSSLGGLRVGEMEEWCLSAHGVARHHAEKFGEHSDRYYEHICRCGRPAIVNHNTPKIYKCTVCGDNADISAVSTTRSAVVLAQELKSMNIGVKRMLKPYKYEIKH